MDKTPYQALIKILSYGVYTRYEAENKLAAKKLFTQREINEALSLAQKQGYINDARYAEMYVNKFEGTKGAVKIKAELKRRGVAVDLIEAALEEKQPDIEGAIRFVQANPKKTRDQLIRALAYRGYPYSVISQAIKRDPA